MSKWSVFDKNSGITFTIELRDNGKYFMNCTYNSLKVDVRHYDFDESGIDSLQSLLNSVRADIASAVMAKVLKPKKKKKK